MTTRSAVGALSLAVTAARARLREVRQSAEDNPGAPATVVVDLVEEACDDLDGWLAAAEEAVDGARSAARQRHPLAVAEQLATCAAATDRAVSTYVVGLGGADSVGRLRDLAADRAARARAGGEPDPWTAWTWTVTEGIGTVWSHLSDTRSALDRCWLELVEHLLNDPVEVRTTPAPPERRVDDVLAGGQ